MSLVQAVRSRRDNERNRRALHHAIAGAATTALRDELIVLADTRPARSVGLLDG